MAQTEANPGVRSCPRYDYTEDLRKLQSPLTQSLVNGKEVTDLPLYGFDQRRSGQKVRAKSMQKQLKIMKCAGAKCSSVNNYERGMPYCRIPAVW